MAGTLFVVGTPIGNLEDITLRALRTLREVDLVAAEDTRRTSKLLAHYDIRRPLTSLHEHNEAAEAPRLVARLRAGESIALVSDAGTPGISDPGARLVRAARDAGVTVSPVPGPSAVAAALSVSGLAGTTYTFMGFPPSSGLAREQWFERAAAERGVVVLFESPHRIKRTLCELHNSGSNRRTLALREMTKINEELVESQMTPPDIREKGEFTIILAPPETTLSVQVSDSTLAQMIGQLTDAGGFDPDESLVIAARYHDVPVRVARKAVKKSKILAKQQNRPPA